MLPSDRLRRDTRPLHRQTEAMPLNQRVASGQASYPEVVRFYQLQHRFHYAAEAKTAELRAAFPEAFSGGLSRCGHLTAILHEAGYPPAEPQAPALAENSAKAWGWAYVAEGSSLGARLIEQRLYQQFGQHPLCGGLLPHSDGEKALWQNFTRLLNEELNNHDYPDALAGAEAAFRLFQELAAG